MIQAIDPETLNDEALAAADALRQRAAELAAVNNAAADDVQQLADELETAVLFDAVPEDDTADGMPF